MSVTAQDKDDRAMRHYLPDVTKLPADFQRLLENYSGIPADQTVAHVNHVRRAAFDICPYPCIGHWKFMALTLLSHPDYPRILERLKSGQTFLDVGCCFAQDMRQLVADGVPSEHLYGLELEQQLVTTGHDLFCDEKTLQATFLIGDMLSPPAHFQDLYEQFDIVNASAILHLFPWKQQVQLASLIARFTRGNASIVGRMTGSTVPAEYPALHAGATGWRHDVASLQRLFDEVGKVTDTKWKASGTLDLEGCFPVPDGKPKDPKELPVWWEPNMRRLLFSVQRL
ncbi:Hypothetical predicted protein [Lecanosticta acicola]|uniref:Methyltransferase domain-containing protein n=1 Tax=Lecanosticta acicola TaxID=111012 RepID=A0AAI9EBJ4_9PEZI|nr:Hypothetical predicted protein [Lecanosticta acicola]